MPLMLKTFTPCDMFDGGHTIPDEVAQFAVDWFLERI